MTSVIANSKLNAMTEGGRQKSSLGMTPKDEPSEVKRFSREQDKEGADFSQGVYLGVHDQEKTQA